MSLDRLSAMDGEMLDGIWYVHLRSARSQDDVLASVREFLGALTPQERAKLGSPCEVHSARDIPRLSSLIARTYETLASDCVDRAVFLRAIAFLCYATDRLWQVPQTSSDPRETAL